MSTTLPANATKANSDASTDDPAQSILVDLVGVVDKFNSLMAALGAAGQLNLGDGLETVAQAGGTPDDVRVKLQGNSALARAATGLALDIAGQTALTAPATGDEAVVEDVSAGARRKITLANLWSVVNAFTELTTPDGAADFVPVYDASAAAIRKVKPDNLGAAGGWVLLSTQNPAAVASVDFTSGIDTTYDAYAIVVKRLRPVTDNVDLWLRVSDDAGSSWKAGAADYQYAVLGLRADNIAGNTASGGDSKVILTNAEQVGNAANEWFSGIVFMYHPGGGDHTNFSWNASFADESAARINLSHGSGKNAANLTVDGLRLLFASGNISSGEVSLYGIKE